jgi:competence protein ComEA
MLSNILFKTFKVFLGVILGLTMLMGQAHAAIEVNSADQTALESVRGLGPSKAKAILAERKKNGPFKDSNDLHTRVKGIGEKTVERLMSNGLTVNSKSSVANQEPKRNLKKESTKEGTKENAKENTKEKTTRRSNKEKSESGEVGKTKKIKETNKPS